MIKLVPTVTYPTTKKSYSEKAYWTGIVLLIYMVFSQVPLYGIDLSSSDPFFVIRSIIASSRGTLMELGTSPMMTSEMVMQGLSAFGLADPADPLYEGCSKLVGLIITFGQAFYFTYTGFYGNISRLKSFFVIIQLTFSGILLLLMDELLTNGWGLGSGSNLFVASNFCENLVWKALSPVVLSSGRFKTFEGALFALPHLITTRGNFTRAIKEALFRKNAPNLSTLIATIFMFFFVVYLQGFRFNIPIHHVKIKGHSTVYPIKLFYTSTTPIMLHNAITTNIKLISRILNKKFPDLFITRLFGNWKENEPINGLVWIITAPKNIRKDFMHFLVYSLFTMVSCGFLSRAWIEMSGKSPKDVAKRLKDQNLTIKGYRQETLIKVLYKYIPLAANAGGVAIGLVTIVSEILGIVGSGTGILLAVGTIFSYYESYLKESENDEVSFLGI